SRRTGRPERNGREGRKGKRGKGKRDRVEAPGTGEALFRKGRARTGGWETCLASTALSFASLAVRIPADDVRAASGEHDAALAAGADLVEGLAQAPEKRRGILRSEEHTSELQSRENLVCRLLLEKKNNTQNTNNV